MVVIVHIHYDRHHSCVALEFSDILVRYENTQKATLLKYWIARKLDIGNATQVLDRT
jgi:hypothetical protein